MERNELIFLAIIVIAYILCSLTLNMPKLVHYIFICLILIILAVTILQKYQKKLNNEQISKISYILAAIFLALYIICFVSEIWYHTKLIDSSILLIPFFGSLVVSWFFKNS